MLSRHNSHLLSLVFPCCATGDAVSCIVYSLQWVGTWRGKTDWCMRSDAGQSTQASDKPMQAATTAAAPAGVVPPSKLMVRRGGRLEGPGPRVPS
ncbi:hypothetical protein LZ30DRAFT_695311 [Colletotrichum cereale]|nr:hypothetical protein LZ30DRAFT_695311 [Colletotrichum cereale]